MFPKSSLLQGQAVLYTLLILLTFISCKKEEVDLYDCTGLTPTYTADIKPILDASCATSDCHDAVSPEQGVNLSTYASASEVSSRVEFLGVIQHKKGYPKMPEDAAKLPEAQIELLTCWVQNGSPQ